MKRSITNPSSAFYTLTDTWHTLLNGWKIRFLIGRPRSVFFTRSLLPLRCSCNLKRNGYRNDHNQFHLSETVSFSTGTSSNPYISNTGLKAGRWGKNTNKKMISFSPLNKTNLTLQSLKVPLFYFTNLERLIFQNKTVRRFQIHLDKSFLMTSKLVKSKVIRFSKLPGHFSFKCPSFPRFPMPVTRC